MPALLPISEQYAVGFSDEGQAIVAGAQRSTPANGNGGDEGRQVAQPDKREVRRVAHAHREQLLHQVALLTQWLAATEQPSEERRIVVAPAGMMVR